MASTGQCSPPPLSRVSAIGLYLKQFNPKMSIACFAFRQNICIHCVANGQLGVNSFSYSEMLQSQLCETSLRTFPSFQVWMAASELLTTQGSLPVCYFLLPLQLALLGGGGGEKKKNHQKKKIKRTKNKVIPPNKGE